MKKKGGGGEREGDGVMEDKYAITLQIRLFKNYSIESSCEFHLKWKMCPFNGQSMSLLGLKQFLIWVFILLVMVSFILRGKSVISAISAN